MRRLGIEKGMQMDIGHGIATENGMKKRLSPTSEEKQRPKKKKKKKKNNNRSITSKNHVIASFPQTTQHDIGRWSPFCVQIRIKTQTVPRPPQEKTDFV